ncbi:diguanylate cyclase (GGDEF)-like protein/PAS domain S-box-containing protein [Halomonas campaniensis]|uniref:cyclic-guanylate-specific phosphodiesterase n=1 Tax=Halomonas campaniensis TaxID=213554 RepID=A0A7W5K0L1_9GAMM|nr:EAL domain-containing protein [Halomonas campaniensis]MBB3329739.1 diguanylate cyclase (GGDEF)-like protein/PAS domain S-box-containing protein [Halomonas campaniensis]
MPIKIRYLALDALLLMVATLLATLGLAGLLSGWLAPGASPLFGLLGAGGYLALLLAGLALVGLLWRRQRLGRLAMVAGLAGVLASSLAWAVLSGEQHAATQRQAGYLLDNIQLNAEQVMASRLTLMRRMADRLDAAGGELDAGVMRRDVQSYLNDAGSLQGIGLRDGSGEWVWVHGRDAGRAEWLRVQLEDAAVMEWLAAPFEEPRMMVPSAESPGLALMVIAVPSSGQQLVTLLDTATLLGNELRVQLGLYRVRVEQAARPLLELRLPGTLPWATAGLFEDQLLARRHVGLPGGTRLTLAAYPGPQHDWLQAGLAPARISAGWLLLSWLLAFSLGLSGQLMARSRALASARSQLEAQHAIQTMIACEAPLESTLAEISRMLERQLPGSLCSIMLASEDGRVLRLAAGGSLPAAYCEGIREIAIGPRAGACGSAAFLQAPVICDDLAQDRRWSGFHPLLREHGLAACWSCPVLGSDGRLLGTFATYYRQPGAPGSGEMALLEKAAGLVALAVERQQSRRSLRLLERSVESSINGVVIVDANRPDLPIIYVNAAFERLTGYSRQEAQGRNCRFLQGENTDPEAVEAIRSRLARHEEVHVTLCNYHKDGTPFWNDLYISPVRDGRGEVTHFVGVQHDVSQHKSYEAKLAHHASHDALTGLGNRSLFEDRLAHDASLAQRQRHRLAVLFIDLDGFKPINDALGHAVGDRVLIEVARRLEAAVRAGDTVARLGGDEFVLLLPGLLSEEQVLEVVERLMPLIAQPYCVDGQELYLTCSVGIALSEPEMADPQALLQQADMAMFQAKQQGRNTYQWFTRAITEKFGERVSMRNDLQEAIDTQAFQLYYQPLVDRDGELVAVEALLRWEHPRRGFVSPAVFIPLAESTGQIMPISRWVLERACRDMLALEQKGLGRVKVAVNLSPLQFHRPSFLATLRQTLQETGLPAEQLELELTEGILMDNTELAIDILHALRGMRVDVSIDDFGTGFSSLSYLRQLPISTVKIDRSFVRDVTRNPQDAAIVQGIISMAGHLGLRVVAEGIETREQRQQLADYGCDTFQGYLLARPMPLEDLALFLASPQPA